jgi:lysyl endopeptidase
MMRALFALLVAVAPSLVAAAGLEMPARATSHEAVVAEAFRAPRLVPMEVVALEAPTEKAALSMTEEPGGRIRVGTVRALEKSTRLEQWIPVAGGFVSKLRASSDEAVGLRVKLELGDLAGAIEVRVQGLDGRIESMIADPSLGAEAWTPWTEGSVQVIELFSPYLPAADGVKVGAVIHFTASPLAKAAGTCTVPTMCAPSDTSLAAGVGSAIAERKKSVMKLNFIDGSSSYICSGTLINTDKFPAAYVLTANHCINNASAALSLTTLWFYESTACDGAFTSAGSVQVAGGAQLVLGNQNVDSTLLLLNRAAPSGALFSGWNAARLSSGTPIVSISHPAGDTSRYAIGSVLQEYRIVDRPQDMYGVHFSKGIIEGGSSGSGLFTMAGSTLQLRGILTGTTVRQEGGMSCTNLNEDALYSRFEIFYPQIAQYVSNSGQAADDAPNRVQDFAGRPLDTAGADAPLNTRADTVAIDNRRIDYAGDLDLYRFTISASSYVSVWTQGANIDTVGSILDSRGVSLESNDDAQAGDNHTGITRKLSPGTYYFQVAHWDAAGTGAYNVRMRADVVDANYTDLWWNPAESGWGLNLDHQGNTVFATLFTFDASGAPLWLVMSQGALQADGSFQGTLYRSTGPAFNATSFLSANVVAVGSMRILFTGPDLGTLTYSFEGAQVTKTISRQVFSTPPTCTWSAFDRSAADNFQDLWWNPSEPGWGVNIAHQGNTLFATLFTYEANNQGVWLVMSNGARSSEGRYAGPLYRMHGPAFNAVPWTTATPTQVGTMSFTFTNGNAGTMTYSFNGVAVTKAIQRQVFAPLKTQCEE